MRILSELINTSGTNINTNQPLIIISPVDGSSDSTLYYCQISVEFFNGTILNPSGLYTPDYSTAVTTGLSGTLTFNVYPTKYAPYAIPITPSNVINISNNSILQWIGVVYSITVTTSSIVGCNYIAIYLDRQ